MHTCVQVANIESAPSPQHQVSVALKEVASQHAELICTRAGRQEIAQVPLVTLQQGLAHPVRHVLRCHGQVGQAQLLVWDVVYQPAADLEGRCLTTINATACRLELAEEYSYDRRTCIQMNKRLPVSFAHGYFRRLDNSRTFAAHPLCCIAAAHCQQQIVQFATGNGSLQNPRFLRCWLLPRPTGQHLPTGYTTHAGELARQMGIGAMQTPILGGSKEA